ncbi:hypothetical protein BU26DRAFT_525241 [Trematosphaeria pertusa]|uniref:Uncharacterized protein n=1 Tax=Trematosphaeria pertusa TaxID=390896 RepID=A0A6A6HTR3_9PLEO|nr:uncharacterized protein BU26DRAFT_525241 [Trematosphaeria pertusa]KAF2241417.1 hypothetical protein BU26DRAFT_525241 [Trematosphaeria pertusa]
MSLERETLTKNDEFFNDAPTGVTVVGSGQMIYWKQCTIKVYKTGEEQKPVRVITTCNGQALVRRGTSLLLEEGLVVEE